jgi:hypothetical protein
MTINNYYIGGYSIVAIGGYSINGYCGYYINDYWWLLH